MRLHESVAPSKFHNTIPDATLACSLILVYLLDSHLPLIEIIPSRSALIGWLVVAAGAGLIVYVISLLRSRQTSTDPLGMPVVFITNGLFSLSRNPLYLSYVIVVIGAAIVSGSLTAFIAPIICFAVLHFVIIPIEEKNLQKKFGQEYAYYKRTVRRWL